MKFFYFMYYFFEFISFLVFHAECGVQSDVELEALIVSYKCPTKNRFCACIPNLPHRFCTVFYNICELEFMQKIASQTQADLSLCDMSWCRDRKIINPGFFLNFFIYL